MKPYSVDKLVAAVRAIEAARDANPDTLPARAFHLAHRARRMLENAADTAARNRWSVLVQPEGPAPRDPIARAAVTLAQAAIKYPAHGEAAVYAAMLDAVDAAVVVSDRLHQDLLATQRTQTPVEVEPGVNRLGGPMASGCRRVCLGASDEDFSS